MQQVEHLLKFDFEKMLANYPKKFNVAKCLSVERTFPACFNPVQKSEPENQTQSLAKRIGS